MIPGDATAEVLLVGPAREEDARALAASGHRTRRETSVFQGLMAVADQRARVVVLAAAELTGREQAAVLAFKELPSSPQVLLTLPPGRLPEDRPRAGLFGADDWIVEPYLPAELLGRLEILLRRARDRGAGRPPAAVSPDIGPAALAGLVSDFLLLSRASNSFEQFVDTVVDVFERRAGANRVSLLLHDRKHDELLLRKAVGLPPDVTVETRTRLDHGIAGCVATRGEPVLVKDFARDHRRALSNGGPYETPSCLSLPLSTAGQVLAVLNLADKRDGSPFDEADLCLLLPLAAQAAHALDTFNRIRHLKKLSIQDNLTGLFNHRHFRLTLEREFRRAVRYQRPLTLAILDLDHFKTVNDVHGHEVGNHFLRRIADLLRGCFRATDTVARYGGEEFAVILPEIEKDGDGALRVLQRFRQMVHDAPFEGEDALPQGRVTISGGVASFPADAQTIDDLVAAADRALYRAKEAGRNRIFLAGE